MQKVASHDVGYVQLNISFSVVVGLHSIRFVIVSEWPSVLFHSLSLSAFQVVLGQMPFLRKSVHCAW